jgi:uracil-DNA glycosylase
MHPGGAASGPSKKDHIAARDGVNVPATDDEIQEKYLERAIRELNDLTHRLQDCSHCPRGNLMPVLGSGHPQADIMLLKFAPTAAEIEEGVAFYGRAGNALRKSFRRLNIDPLVVYGTLCVKCPVSDPSLAGGECIERIVEEIAIVQPKIVVVMGEPALETLNDMDVPLSRELEPDVGSIQGLTPTIDALYVPDIDESLDSEESKRDFWSAFRALGDWYADLPPY